MFNFLSLGNRSRTSIVLVCKNLEEMVSRMTLVLWLLQAKSIVWLYEQPTSSILWHHPRMTEFIRNSVGFKPVFFCCIYFEGEKGTHICAFGLVLRLAKTIEDGSLHGAHIPTWVPSMHHLLRGLCCGEADHKPNCCLATFQLTKSGPMTSPKSQNQGFPVGRGWKSLKPTHRSLGWPRLNFGGKRLPMDHGTLTKLWFLIYGPINPKRNGGRMQSWQKSCNILPWSKCLVGHQAMKGWNFQWTFK